MPFARAWCPLLCAFLESGGIAVDLFVNNCGREACAPGHRFGPAMRGYHLIHIAASGCGVFDNGAARFDVRAGQGFMIFPDDVSVYTADAQTPWDYVWVGFLGDGAEALAASAGFSKENPVFDLGGYAETALGIAYGVCDDMATLRLGGQAALGGLMRLMAYIAQCRASQPAVPGGADSYRRALWLLNANYQRPDFRIAEVASFVGLSRSQLFRVFKAQCGRSPMDDWANCGCRTQSACSAGRRFRSTKSRCRPGFPRPRGWARCFATNSARRPPPFGALRANMGRRSAKTLRRRS